jgi:NAD-dependent deacetylase
MNEKIAQIATKIKEGGKNVVFTGAGISTESGIPDYRSQGGIWDKVRPVYFDKFMSSKESRVEYWRQRGELYQKIAAAKPNKAHIALARLNEMGLLQAVVTQNIDGLHQASGLPDDKIVELHGNTCRIRCMSCQKISPIDKVQQRLTTGDPAPECECGGFLKPDTISLPAAHMPIYAKNNGAFLAIINLSDTPCDAMCDVLIRAKAGEVMQQIVSEVEKA